jgi:hypothetical protein
VLRTLSSIKSKTNKVINKIDDKILRRKGNMRLMLSVLISSLGFSKSNVVRFKFGDTLFGTVTLFSKLVDSLDCDRPAAESSMMGFGAQYITK